MSKQGPVESLASLSRTTRPITRRTKTDNLSCSWCSSNISPMADHAVLSPCECAVCPKCLLRELAPRGRNEAQCSSCESLITSHQYFEAWMPQLPRVEYHEQEKEEEINDKKWLQQPMKCLSLTSLRNRNDCVQTCLLAASHSTKQSSEKSFGRQRPTSSVSNCELFCPK